MKRVRAASMHPFLFLSPRTTGRFIFLAVWFTTNSVQGAHWYFQPGANISAGYEENVQLAPTDEFEQNTQRYEVEALASGGRRTETSEIIFDLGINRLRYPQARDLDSNNFSAGIGSAYRLGLDLFRLDATYDRDTSRLSELTTTGRIQGNVPRNAYTITPSWSRPLTERSEVGIIYAYTSVAFDEGDGFTGLVDYDVQDLDAFYNYEITERVTFLGELGASFYRPDTPLSSDTYTAALGLSYEITDTLTADFLIGPQYVKAEVDDEPDTRSDSESGNVYEVNLAKRLERGAFSLSLSKGQVPTGSAETVDQTRLGAAFSHDFTERLAFTLPADVYRSETSGADGARRLFFAAEPALSWRITDDIGLTASYRYRYQHFSDTDLSADSNAVFLSLTYLWPTEPAGLASPF